MLCSTRLSLQKHACGYRRCCSQIASYNLKLSSQDFTVYKFAESHFFEAFKEFSGKGRYLFMTRTPAEFSIIAESGVACSIKPLTESPNWKMVFINSPIPFEATGVLHAVVAPLSAKKISILAISSFDSDFFFFQKEWVPLACQALQDAGFPLEIE